MWELAMSKTKNSKIRSVVLFSALTCLMIATMGCSKTDKNPPDDDDFQGHAEAQSNSQSDFQQGKACATSCIETILNQRSDLSEFDRQDLLSCKSKTADSSSAVLEAQAAIKTTCL
jgi:hypothetical protein